MRFGSVRFCFVLLWNFIQLENTVYVENLLTMSESFQLSIQIYSWIRLFSLYFIANWKKEEADEEKENVPVTWSWGVGGCSLVNIQHVSKDKSRKKLSRVKCESFESMFKVKVISFLGFLFLFFNLFGASGEKNHGGRLIGASTALHCFGYIYARVEAMPWRILTHFMLGLTAEWFATPH